MALQPAAIDAGDHGVLARPAAHEAAALGQQVGDEVAAVAVRVADQDLARPRGEGGLRLVVRTWGHPSGSLYSSCILAMH